MSSISLFTRAKASDDADKGAASPPRGGGLRAQSRSLLELRPQVTQIRLSLHHLGEVAWEVYLGCSLWELVLLS